MIGKMIGLNKKLKRKIETNNIACMGARSTEPTIHSCSSCHAGRLRRGTRSASTPKNSAPDTH